MLHLFFFVLLQLRKETHVHVAALNSHCAYSEPVSLSDIFYDFLYSLRSLHLNTTPSVPFLRQSPYRSHGNHIVNFILLNQRPNRFRERVRVDCEVGKEIPVLLKRNLKIILANLNENLTANHRRGSCNRWNDFSSLDFYFVERQFVNGVILCSEIGVESDEVNVSVLVVVFLKLDLFDFLGFSHNARDFL